DDDAFLLHGQSRSHQGQALVRLSGPGRLLIRQMVELSTTRLRPRSMTSEERAPAEQSAKYRHDLAHAQDGPSFTHMKRAHPRASDTEIKLAIMAAVKFDDACAKYFSTD